MENTAVLIRRAVADDAAGLCQYVADLFAERLPMLFLRDALPSIEDERGFIEKMRTSPRHLLLVAEHAGEIVGLLDFHGHPETQRDHGGEFGMSVARLWRGRGIGRRLLDEMLRWAPSAGIRRVELRVFSNNAAAIQLYKSAGFVMEGRQTEAVRVNDAYVDIIFMAKTL